MRVGVTPPPAAAQSAQQRRRGGQPREGGTPALQSAKQGLGRGRPERRRRYRIVDCGAGRGGRQSVPAQSIRCAGPGRPGRAGHGARPAGRERRAHGQRLPSAASRPRVDASASACVSDTINLPVPQPGQYLKLGASYDRMVAFLRDQDASSQTMRVPVWIAQAGSDNRTPTPQTMARMDKSMCTRNKSISMQTYAGQNPRSGSASVSTGCSGLCRCSHGRPRTSAQCMRVELDAC